ncbi:hypothetical protein M0R45_024542 [Rubus argutus]|uniref:Subtilisin-like protease fibronectin type-III domain-containing protein n=1 Tax=Rubus argutus TaxID=59490 RepID=A0AAW1WSS9_RUBAR
MATMTPLTYSPQETPMEMEATLLQLQQAASASGATAYVKAAQPNRSTAAIKSALMTPVEDGQNINTVFTRTVTNVGSPNSTYSIKAHTPLSDVSVKPSTISLPYVGENKSFTVKVTGPPLTLYHSLER